VLKLAPAAASEVRTGGNNTLGSRFQDP